MESFDQHIIRALDDSASTVTNGPAEILVVSPEGALQNQIAAALDQRDHTCTFVTSLNEARIVLPRGRFDLVVLCWQLPDGGGVELTPVIHKASPAAKIIVLCETISCETAVQAMRCGAVDCLSLPLNADEFLRRIDPALLKSRSERQRDERLVRLKKICRELNVARHEISRQVDALCDDLSNAYRDMADQMSDVALASEFRTLLKQELDVEDLLRTTLEYLLTKTGPTNAAVFLPDAPHGEGEPQHFGLGAYVNYDCPRETISLLLDHLGRAICPQMADEKDIVSFSDAREFAQWVGATSGTGREGGVGFLATSQIIAFSCLHQGECLAVIVLFRNKTTPFAESLAATIDTMRQIIAEQLSNVIRVHHRARQNWPKEAKDGDMDYSDDDLGFGYEGGLAA